jgi:hypothetical protein
MSAIQCHWDSFAHLIALAMSFFGYLAECLLLRHLLGFYNCIQLLTLESVVLYLPLSMEVTLFPFEF